MVRWNWINDEEVVFHASSEAETWEIASKLAPVIKLGDTVALIGDLGSGKTRFVKALAAAWGVPDDEVSSPTFTLIQEYEGTVLVRHCDTYRLRDAEEFADLGLDELFAADGVALVEWADRVVEYLPRDRLEVRITIESPVARNIGICATGVRTRRILGQLRDMISA